MDHSSPSLFTFTPENTLKGYLGISLGEYSPYIAVKETFLIAEKYPNEKLSKINKQIALLQETIQFLKNSHLRLPSFRSDSPPLAHSSSSESLPFNSPREDIFNKHLDMCKKSSDEERTKNKSKILLCVFQSQIFPIISENTTLEKFHRNNLASALECHQTLYFNPEKPFQGPKPTHLTKSLPTAKSPAREKFSLFRSSKEPTIPESKSEQASAIKELNTATYDTLYSYWFALNLSHKKIDSCQLPSFSYDSILEAADKKLIQDHHLYEPRLMATTVQESIIREFFKLDLEILGHDLYRQADFIKIKKNMSEFYTLKESKAFEMQCAEFINFLKILLEDEKKEESKKIFLKFEELKKEEQTLGDLCGSFLKFLKFENSLITKKLYRMLLPLTQKTYMFPANVIARLFPKLEFKWGEGKKYRSIEYLHAESRVETSVKTSSVKTNNFDLFIKNIIIVDFNDISKSTSHIFFEIYPYHNKDEKEIKKIMERPLTHLGFKVEIKTEGKIVPGPMKIS